MALRDTNYSMPYYDDLINKRTTNLKLRDVINELHKEDGSFENDMRLQFQQAFVEYADKFFSVPEPTANLEYLRLLKTAITDLRNNQRIDPNMTVKWYFEKVWQPLLIEIKQREGGT